MKRLLKNLPLFALTTLLVWGCGITPEPFEEEKNPDGGAIIRCARAGGHCTESPQNLCGSDAQPLTQNDPGNTNCVGHCCVKAEPTPCSENFDWTCVPGACAGGWKAVEGTPLCFDGRVCCYWGS